jgi:RNA polymerase sigma factor for flagellar operon FliA
MSRTTACTLLAAAPALLTADVFADCARLVEGLAWRMKFKLPAHIEADDLIQAGMVGLVESAHRFDVARCVPFKAFALTRIRGAMLDELRRDDALTRGARERVRSIGEAAHRAAQHHGRAPRESEVAGVLALPLAELRALCADPSRPQVDDWDEGEEAADSDAPDLADLVDSRRQCAALAGAIRRLPKRERAVVTLRHFHDRDGESIGAALGLSASRVSQLHRSALRLLRADLAGAALAQGGAA